MKKSFLSIFLFCILSLSSSAKVTNTRRLEWIDPYGRQPVKYSLWSNEHSVRNEKTKIGKVYEKGIKERQNVVDVVVNKNIYPALTAQIDTFVDDLVIAGYVVQLDTIVGMSHIALRSHLAGIANLVGAIFIGELPVAWFETNGFGNWEEFPHDLYFCDLDGTYIDADGDSIYDNHTGNVEPEIWVGRIYARNLTWDNERRLLKNYFHKDHQYRTYGSSLPERGLAFVDDDWSYWGNCYLNLLYSNVVVINNDYQTTAANYRNQLAQGYEWVHLCAHSSPWGHTFKDGYGGFKGTVFNYEIFTLEPHALFYNLFACSGTRFVEENYSAGWYLFVEPYGLLAVGSTKTGSMLYFDDFYGPIGQQNMCIGDAFKYWFTLWGETDWDWFYGMNILGDPTLKPKSQVKKLTRDSLRVIRPALAHAKQSCTEITTPTDFTLNSVNVVARPVKYHYLQNYFLFYGARNDNKRRWARTDWEQPEIVASDPESDGFPKIATNIDGKIWSIWESGRSTTNGRSEIYSSYRNGGSWSNAMVVGPSYYWDYCPDIGVDNLNRPVAVWAGWQNGSYQYDIFYSIYTGSWSTRQMVYPLDPAFDLKPTLLRDNSGLLWVTWESRRDVDLNIYASHFNGSSWILPEQVTTSEADETTPQMVVDSAGKVWVFYCRKYAGNAEIWGSYYTGTQWVASGPISGNQKNAYRPSAAVDGNGEIWVAWQATDGGNSDIYLSSFEANTWSSPFKLTSNPESDLFPDITAEHNGPIWLVYQSKSGGDWDIYYSYCSDSVWSSPTPVSNLSGADINPQITCSNADEVWVVWQTYSTGNWEIMVSHRPGLGVTEEEKKTAKPNFSISSTLFSRSLKITTEKPNQKIRIYDIKGSLIQSLLSNKNNIAFWLPRKIPSGIYFIMTQKVKKHNAKKVIFVQ